MQRQPVILIADTTSYGVKTYSFTMAAAKRAKTSRQFIDFKNVYFVISSKETM